MKYILIVLLLCVPTSIPAEEKVCEVERPSIVERIVNRSYPSVFTTWQWGLENDPQSPNESHWSYQKRSVSRRDLFVQGSFRAQVYFQYLTPEGSKLVFRGSGEEYVDDVVDQRNQIQSLNPDFLFLASFQYYGAHPSDYYPEDWKYWLRDEEGNRIPDEGYGEMLIDYTLPGAEEHFVHMAVSVKACGIFDGIFMDLWGEEEGEELPSAEGTAHLYHGNRVEALVSLVKRIREAVGDNFLIIVNTRTEKIPRSAPYINGAFIETWDKAYPRERLIEIEHALLWYEDNFRYPQINSLEVAKSPSEPWDSPDNHRLARATTTLMLTHSNGSISITGKQQNPGARYWYPFFDAPLGGTLGGDETKGVLYETPKGEEIEGLFIREFTNGYAVYNRSGKERKVYLPEKVSGWASGVKGKHWHTIPDLDGEIFLKQMTPTAEPSIGTKNRYDVDDDGNVDISDVRRVVIALGQKGKNITNPRTDVNKNNKVDKNDVLLVIDNLDDANAAPLNTDLLSPISEETMQLLNPMTLRSTLEALHLENDGSLKYQQAIAYLEHLLAAIRPDATQLLANYPNPFNPETWIPYHLANPSNVQITIYDTHGSIVRHLNLGHQRAGIYTGRGRAAYWDGRNDVGERVASGIYFYQLQADGLSYLRKMVIVK